MASVAGVYHVHWPSGPVSCLPFVCNFSKECAWRNVTRKMPSVATGLGASWREQSRVPSYRRDRRKLGTACSSSVNHPAGKLRLTQHGSHTDTGGTAQPRSDSSAPAALEFILRCAKVYSCLKFSLIMAKWKTPFLGVISCVFGEACNIVLFANTCDLFTLLKVFLADERHLLLLGLSPMQTRLFWWDSGACF